MPALVPTTLPTNKKNPKQEEAPLETERPSRPR